MNEGLKFLKKILLGNQSLAIMANSRHQLAVIRCSFQTIAKLVTIS